MALNRRRFLGFAVGAAAGTAVGVPAGRALGDLLQAAELPVYPPRGPESFILSVCNLCPGGCGVRVRRIGGRAVKVDGNPFHPVNGRRLCPRGQAALQGLYHPDRLPGPLRRVGPRGSLRSFERVSWDRALAEIAARLKTLRDTGRPESLVLLRGGARRIGSRLARRFLAAFGSPNDLTLERGEDSSSLSVQLGQGLFAAPVYDLPSADYVLSLGGALLEAWSSPVHTSRAYGHFRQGRTGLRGKLVQVEPRLSVTAASADEWIAVRPGTEGVFGLGVAAVIVAEGLYDKEFVAERTTGLENFAGAGAEARRPGLRELLDRDYTLERVAEETGVSANVILDVAREFAAARRSVAVGPRRGPLLPGSLHGHLAAQTLNGLVGSIDSPGGVLVAEETPLAPWPPLPEDRVGEQGRAKPRIDAAGKGDFSSLPSDPERLADAILSGSPYPVEALLILEADPVFASFAPDRFATALERVPLVVSFATLPDDTALRADWILPEAHFLEQWELHTTPPGLPYPVVSLAQPALSRPLHDVRPASAIFLELARRTGPEVAAALPWPDVESLLKGEIDGLYENKRGALMGTTFDEAWVRMMEGAGWWAPGYRSAEELWKKSQERGGWWDPFYDHGDWKRVLATRSGRFEFRADILERRPGAAPPGRPEAGADALVLVLFEPLPISCGTGAELPYLQGILDPGHEERWETWAEIHPETAAALQIRDREIVTVSSSHGAIQARARVGPRVVPGVVGIPVGLGKRGGGRWAAGVGANPLSLISGERELFSGLPDPGAVKVRVAKAAGLGPARPESRRG